MALEQLDLTAATVQVLRAEVRTLMVGSRQVTMSVFQQLDMVPWGEITPFGRVRPPHKEPDDDGWVVGSSASNVLVRANWYKAHARYEPRWDDVDDREVERLSTRIAERERRVAELKDGAQVYFESLERVESDAAQLRQALKSLLHYKHDLPARLEAWRQARAAFRALPLIVLAGLR